MFGYGDDDELTESSAASASLPFESLRRSALIAMCSGSIVHCAAPL